MKNNKYYHTKIDVQDYPFEPIIISDIYNDLIIQFNKSKTQSEKYNIAKQLPDGIFPVCRFCGDIIINENFKLKRINNTVQIITPNVWCRQINNVKYYLSCCEKCLLNHFKDEPPKSHKYYFMKANKFGAYSFGYSEEEYKKICSMTVGVTLESMQRKWGVEEGKHRWETYCKQQSVTNTFEYKQQKYGWDVEQFDSFNKSRAITKDNLIKKYGDLEGTTRWDEYVNKQKLTKSFDYMCEHFGEDIAKQINKSKALTLENFIKRHGEENGYKLYLDYTNKHKNYYSKISQNIFNKLDYLLSDKYTTYFATKGNGEYGIRLGSKYIKLDYYIKELNICVEFNGTHFHADPTIYNENDNPNFYNKNLTAKDIWENDNIRYKELNNMGIKTFIIWEREYDNFDAYKFITETLNIKLT